MMTFSEFNKLYEGKLWYHGTTSRRYNQMVKSGHLEPHESDEKEYGKASWFTSDPDEAREYGKVVLSIPHHKIKKFKHKRLSLLPRGTKMSRKERADYGSGMLSFDKIPIKHLTKT